MPHIGDTGLIWVNTKAHIPFQSIWYEIYFTIEFALPNFFGCEIREEFCD